LRAISITTSRRPRAEIAPRAAVIEHAIPKKSGACARRLHALREFLAEVCHRRTKTTTCAQVHSLHWARNNGLALEEAPCGCSDMEP
jgi:hypothetical protein